MKIIFLLFFVHSLYAQILPDGCPTDHSVHILLRDEDDCGRYYSCSNGFAISMPCPENTLFDENLQVCNWAYKVECGKPASTTTSSTIEVSSTTASPTTVSTTAKEPVTTSVKPTTTDSTNETTAEEQTTITEPKTTSTTERPTTTPAVTSTEIYLEPEDCTKQFDTNSEDEDCEKYFSCEEGARLVLSCRSAKLFNFNFKVSYSKVL